MCDVSNANGVMTLQQYAAKEYRGSPLNTPIHARFPKTLAVFLRSAALTEGVTESTVIRYACEQWANSQGFSRTGV